MIHQRRPAHPQQAPSQSHSGSVAAAPTFSTPAPRTAKGQQRAKMNSNVESRQIPSPSLPPSHERRPLLSDNNEEEDNSQKDDSMGWVHQNKWIVLAIASGACAAFNGVFAKLYEDLISYRACFSA